MFLHHASVPNTTVFQKESGVHILSNIYFILAETHSSGDRIVLLYTQYECVIVLCAKNEY